MLGLDGMSVFDIFVLGFIVAAVCCLVTLIYLGLEACAVGWFDCLLTDCGSFD